jgi:hypothetical protein
VRFSYKPPLATQGDCGYNQYHTHSATNLTTGATRYNVFANLRGGTARVPQCASVLDLAMTLRHREHLMQHGMSAVKHQKHPRTADLMLSVEQGAQRT